MFRKLQMLKKGVETIKKVAPRVGTKKSDQIKKSNRMLKDLDKTMKKDLSPRLKSEGEKLKKEIEQTRKEIYKSKMALGGILGFKKKDKKKEKEKKDSEKGTRPKDLIYKPNKMKRLEELRKELKQDGGPVARGMESTPRKPQYITKKEKPKYITKKEKPQYITKKSKYITKKKKPVEGESKYITRKEKPKYITRKQKDLGRQMGGGPRD
jgi:hypothetical protein